MMGIVLPETCLACNKISNKYHLLLFPRNSGLELCMRMYKIISEVYYAVSLLYSEILLLTYQ